MAVLPPAIRSCAGNIRAVFLKVYLMTWMNGLISIRNISKTFFDIFVPVIFFLLLTLSRKEDYRSIVLKNETILRNFKESFFTPPYGPPLTRAVAYSPNSSVFTELMTKSFKPLNNDTNFDNLTIIGVESAEMLESLLKRNRSIIAGIQFNHANDTEQLPKHISFSIRLPALMRWSNMLWPTDILYKEQIYYRYPRPNLNFYKKEGFLTLQKKISTGFKLIHADSHFYYRNTKMRGFPTYPENGNFETIQFLFLPIVLICFYYSFWNNICFVAAEKQKQLREIMKLMGIRNWLYWLSLFLQKMLLHVISVTIIVAIIKVPMFGYAKAVFQHSNFLLLWLFFIVYSVYLTTFSFFLSIFLSETKSAISVSTIIWFLSFLPFIITHVGYTTLPSNLKMLLCIFPNTAMGYGIKLILQLELMVNGLNWSTLWQMLLPYDIKCVGIIMCIMIYSSIMFFVIVLYTDPIFPGPYGLAKPFYYLCTKQFWCDKSMNQENEQPPKDKLNFEDESGNGIPCIEIRNLCKAYAKRNAVLRNVSLNMYRNEITVLLGNNGAGTSTLISILTGMIKATSGSVSIDGYDIRKYTNSARKSMSFCPQHNVLFHELTVREHILFYSLVRGKSRKAANEEVNKYTELLELETKLNIIASSLSYGEQRKLSIAIALCGQSKLVFLDQPTNGMDPVIRRSLWNVLLNEKKGRHILISTHLSEEADILGDRFAIMTDGRLQCSGSSFFMRKRFGVYRLICVKDDGCKSIETIRFLNKCDSGIVKEIETENQLCFQLSYDKVFKFGRIFEQLEAKCQLLKIKSFSVSLATAEFASIEFNKDLETDESSNHSLDFEEDSDFQCFHKILIIPYQILAMFMKRFLCGMRDWRSYLLHNIAVIVLLIPITADLCSFFPREDVHPLEISLNSYTNPCVFFEGELDTFISNSSDNTPAMYYNFTKGYKQVFASTTGVEFLTMNETDILPWAEQSPLQKYRFQLIFGCTIKIKNKTRRNIWINSVSALHAAPLSFNYFAMAALYPLWPNKTITVTNSPINEDKETYIATREFANMEAFGIDFPILIGIIMSIISSHHIIFYIKERESRSKFMQQVNGVNLIIFWITSILWDLLTSIFTIIIIMIMLFLSKRVYWSQRNTLYIIGIIIFMFNYAILPIICVLSLMFSSPKFGVCVFSVINIFIAMSLFVNNYGVEFISASAKTKMSVIPTCALIESFSKLSTIGKNCYHDCDRMDRICNHQMLCNANTTCCPQLSFLWNDKDIFIEIVFMASTNLVAVIMLLVIETEIIKQLYCLLVNRILNFILRRKSNQTEDVVDSDDVDTDSSDFIASIATDTANRKADIGDGNENNLIGGFVVDDGKHINSMSSENLQSHKLIMQKVSIHYGRFLAVDQVSLHVKNGECVGLIDKNGAGKTSIFKLLTGEDRICNGRAYILGSNLKWNTTNTYNFVGYCPQVDGLLYNLTVYETLKFFSLLRGIPARRSVDIANNLELGQNFQQKVSQLSGGSKRKLSIVIALIGNPKVLLLDEPTTSMDIKSKRSLWEILNQFCIQGKSVLLSSDCIEDYEALCTRLTITNDSSTSMIEHNPTVIELQIEVEIVSDQKPYTSDVNDFILNTFKKAKLISNYNNILTYDIPFSQIKWSVLFNVIEKKKRQVHIEEYFIFLK